MQNDTPSRNTLDEKIAALREIVRDYGSALVAFSGGADSALVLKIAVDELGTKARALTAVSITMARREVEGCEKVGKEIGAVIDFVDSHEIDRPGFAQNPTNRCYYCKTELMELCGPHAQKYQLRVVLLGTNLDDLGDYRPGLQAARERGARSPLVEAGFNKSEVREASRQLGLSTWNKPQLACLSSRFPYGTQITPERLSQVDRFEEALHDLGYSQLRVRFHDEMARLEFEEADLERAFTDRARITKTGKTLGFRFVTIDLQGFRSGSLNEGLVGIRSPRSV